MKSRRRTCTVRSPLCDDPTIVSRLPGNLSLSDESTGDGDDVETSSSGCSIIVTDYSDISQSRDIVGLPILDVNKYKIGGGDGGGGGESQGRAATISRTTGLTAQPVSAAQMMFNRRSQTLQVSHRGTPGTGENKLTAGHHVSFSFGQLDRSASLAVVPGALAAGRGGGTKDVWLEGRIRLDKYMTSKWISGIAVTKRGEFAIVDLQEAFVIDRDGLFRRQIGGKGNLIVIITHHSVDILIVGLLFTTEQMC